MSFDLVLLGGTGDLAWRKLMPALFQAWRHAKLPAGGRILAVGREPHDAAAYHAWLAPRLAEAHQAKRPAPEEFARFAEQVHYLRMDLAAAADYAALARWLATSEGGDARYAGRGDVRDSGGVPSARPVVIYLATSPHLFPAICRHLGAAGLDGPQVRVVLEKPLGHDLASARDIAGVVRSVFREEQALRIDHYLGKPAVQNLMALRFGNGLFEPLWRRECVSHVEITLAEEIGVGTRGDFYDRTGALRDMIQNHALQLLTMIAMEPPARMEADAIGAEKLKVLQALRPFDAEAVQRDVVRGQYRAGTVAGAAVPGYAQEAMVPPDSRCETFVALRTEVQNWRWAGVPFYLRTGKRLADGLAHITVHFKPAPHRLFAGARANRLVIKLQPADGLELHLCASTGDGAQPPALAPVFLDLDFTRAFAAQRVGGYERLLLDAIAGRRHLFVGSDEQEQAWRWVEPILEAWRDDPAGPRPYAAGTWGPAAASALVARDGHAWSEEA